MIGYGAVDAIDFDGGDSATMVITANKPKIANTDPTGSCIPLEEPQRLATYIRQNSPDSGFWLD